MTKKLVLALFSILILSCKQKAKKERTFTDYIEEEEKLILESPTYHKEPRLLLDISAGISKIEYDSLLRGFVTDELIKKENDTLFYLILPNKRDNNHPDLFRLAPAFRNDSLKAILCELREGYFDEYSPSYYFDDFTTLLTEKYGTPKLEFKREPKKTEYNNQIVSELGGSEYNSWIKDGLYIRLNEHSYPDLNSDKESRWLSIYYGSLDFEKSRIKNELEQEHFNSQQKIKLKEKKKKKDIESDSIRKAVL